ncbi:hypothetical protein [Domibacillus iocasae]|uniref:Beta-carotene 15,15'-monooxygenase n=1 Tax=Domibacillus iocasae TaxID=1714016 RepID=A0A1E7DJZ0_9BACI|nr:hypothetical protein [Domibacillus iocasae]OES43411.1 hypothetical protein BA724_13370 [Domibacillus iocasae]
MVYRPVRYPYWAIAFLILVLTSNMLLYRPAVQEFFSIQIESGIAIVSLIDLVIIAPVIAYFVFNLSVKQMIGLMVTGLIAARLLIPVEYFAPYKGILYAGIAAEGLLLVMEVGLLFYVLRKIPLIRKKMRGTAAIYSMLPAVEKAAGNNKLVTIVVSEFLMIYYAFFAWRKKAPSHDDVVTMHMKTSAIAMNMMLIHAIVIETIGIHWWLHEKSIWISIVLLVLNVYSVIFFLAETQVIGLNPIEIKEGKLYAAQGLTKCIIVPLEKVKEVKWGAKPHKEVLEFILKDFEPLEVQVVITLREPLEATMFMGSKKAVTELALRVDEPEKLKQLLQKEM